ncbi:MAG: phosphomethylpyrimidine synthase ThiC, partial [Vulcanimicrobiaceae bacterium]
MMTATITRKPFPGSRKVYASGRDPSIRVPMRAVALSDGETHILYDTSGPYTDSDVELDVRKGLPPIRQAWVEARGDTVELEKPTSIYRIGRESMRELDGIRFVPSRKARVAKAGAAVTQMAYARRGTITL